MTNFSITFTKPWLLLLLVPALLLTLIPYFRLNKRYRCTRNRIVSMALHVVIMLLAVSLLAGVTRTGQVDNALALVLGATGVIVNVFGVQK